MVTSKILPRAWYWTTGPQPELVYILSVEPKFYGNGEDGYRVLIPSCRNYLSATRSKYTRMIFAASALSETRPGQEEVEALVTTLEKGWSSK